MHGSCIKIIKAKYKLRTFVLRTDIHTNPHFIYLLLKHQGIWKQRICRGSEKACRAVVQLICIGLCKAGLQLKCVTRLVTDWGKGSWDLLDEYSDTGNVGVMNTAKHKCQLLSTINIYQRILNISHSSKTKDVSCDLHVIKMLQISDDIPKMNPVRSKPLLGKNVIMKWISGCKRYGRCIKKPHLNLFPNLPSLNYFRFQKRKKVETGWSDHHTDCAYGCVHFKFRNSWTILIKICIYVASLEVAPTSYFLFSSSKR